MTFPLQEHLKRQHEAILGTIVTNGVGQDVEFAAGVKNAIEKLRAGVERGAKTFWVGNGGSAGICSHMATDYSKNGKIPSQSLNDGPMLTCLGNDYGYEHVFDKQIEFFGREGDCLIAISSSGKSQNILNAVKAMRALNGTVITLSGFGEDNPLRQTGDINFYVSSHEYGFVEVGHQTILHAIIDLHMGWTPENDKK